MCNIDVSFVSLDAKKAAQAARLMRKHFIKISIKQWFEQAKEVEGTKKKWYSKEVYSEREARLLHGWSWCGSHRAVADRSILNPCKRIIKLSKIVDTINLDLKFAATLSRYWPEK